MSAAEVNQQASQLAERDKEELSVKQLSERKKKVNMQNRLLSKLVCKKWERLQSLYNWPRTGKDGFLA